MSTTQGRSKSTEYKGYRKFEVGAQQRNQIILGMNKKNDKGRGLFSGIDLTW